MTSPTANQMSARLEATFGLGRDWTSQAGQRAAAVKSRVDTAVLDEFLLRFWVSGKSPSRVK